MKKIRPFKVSDCYRLLFVAVLFLVFACAAKADERIILTADTPWIVPTNPPEPLQRALDDLKRDWYKVLGYRPIIRTEVPKEWTGPMVRFEISRKPDTPESFSLEVEDKTLAIKGSDVRGAIYAVYTMSEEILGVDPWYFWTDHEPKHRKQIEVPVDLKREFGNPTFRYRGWFINDEDLLNRFSPDPMGENPFSLQMLDRVCETLLRLRGNMIVPGTFNFPDEKCWELASRRGLALNMHHILVVGLNTYRWPKDVPFSFTKHPEIMEKYWRDCIAEFEGHEVVWSVGYRGKGDKPFWIDEPELKTSEARGEVITKAIARQVELVREVDPKGMIIANLWKEGVQLIHDGHLKLPKDVVQVWPDNGFGLIRDNGTVKSGQGVYYHTAMLNGGANQLSEMVPPKRIYQELGRFVRADATEFFLLNVSDVRPVPLSSDCAMKFAWNAKPYLAKSDQKNMDLFIADWSQREFGDKIAKKVGDIYNRYFNIPYMQGDDWYTCRGENHLHWRLRNMTRTKSMKKARDGIKFTAEHLPYVAKLMASAEKLARKVPAERKSFYESHVLTPIRIHFYSLKILQNYSYAYANRDADKAELALRGYDDLFEAMRVAETDKWAAWYYGECLVGIEENREYARLLLAELKGEKAPPIRKDEEYPKIYEYQERFSENFPFLYEQPKK